MKKLYTTLLLLTLSFTQTQAMMHHTKTITWGPDDKPTKSTSERLPKNHQTEKAPKLQTEEAK